jgi:hypothetical protein
VTRNRQHHDYSSRAAGSIEFHWRGEVVFETYKEQMQDEVEAL